MKVDVSDIAADDTTYVVHDNCGNSASLTLKFPGNDARVVVNDLRKLLSRHGCLDVIEQARSEAESDGTGQVEPDSEPKLDDNEKTDPDVVGIGTFQPNVKGMQAYTQHFLVYRHPDGMYVAHNLELGVENVGNKCRAAVEHMVSAVQNRIESVLKVGGWKWLYRVMRAAHSEYWCRMYQDATFRAAVRESEHYMGTSAGYTLQVVARFDLPKAEPDGDRKEDRT